MSGTILGPLFQEIIPCLRLVLNVALLSNTYWWLNLRNPNSPRLQLSQEEVTSTKDFVFEQLETAGFHLDFRTVENNFGMCFIDLLIYRVVIVKFPELRTCVYLFWHWQHANLQVSWILNNLVMQQCMIKVERYLILSDRIFALCLATCQNQLSIDVLLNWPSCSRGLFVLLFYVNSCLRWINCLLPLRELRLK